MIHIYKYSRTVPIFRNVSYEGLENTSTMFNDTITLHRNLDNVLNFKLTDRDRRSIEIENKNICVKIVDDKTTLVVDTFYLSPTNNAKVFSVVLPKTFINQLLPRRGYGFFVSLVDAEGKEEPLYIDHDFMMKGELEVVDNYSEIVSEKMNESYSIRLDSHEDEVDGEYVLDSFIDVDENFRMVEFKTYDDQVSDPIKVKIQKHRGKYYPIRPEDSSQWEDFIEVNNIHNHTWSHHELPEGKYRAVLITETPEDYFFVYSKINRL